jgi:hypothetical protein
MRQNRQPNQMDVVCKTMPAGSDAVEVLRLPRFAPELSCCLQDLPRQGRRAKPVRRNALGPKLRCCLQDCRASVCGRAPAGAGGFAQRMQDSSAGIASSTPGFGSAIFGSCPGIPRGIPDRRRFWPDGTRCGACAGTPLRHRLPDWAGISMVGRSAGSRGIAVHPYERRCLIPALSGPPVPEFRNCYRVTTASPPMVAPPTTSSGKSRTF